MPPPHRHAFLKKLTLHGLPPASMTVSHHLLGRACKGQISAPIQPPTHEHGSGTIQTASVQVPALPLTSCVIFDKLLNLSVPSFLTEVETVIGPTSEP